jgi:soluble P-type ATPase
MIELDIPGKGELGITNLVMDLNGTIATDGEIIEGVAERLHRLSSNLDIFIVTADTRGRAEHLIKDLGSDLKSGSYRLHKTKRDKEDIQKLELARRLGSEETISIGNGSNDALMLKESAVGICIVGKEGAAVEAVMSADLVTFDINDALDLLLKPERLVATLRK